jgi:hypothetical protein
MCWFVTGFIFLSFASTKRVLYLMPIFAPIALLTGVFIDTTLEGRRFRIGEKIFLWIFALTPLAVGLACVPAYFFSLKQYEVGPQQITLASVLAISSVVVLFSVASLIFIYARSMARFWLCSGAAIGSLLIFALVVVVPVLDRYKTFVPFCDEVKRIVVTDASLYAYQPDETLRGALPFYTGLHPKEIEDLNALESIIERGSRIYVVIRDSHEHLEKETLSTGKLIPIYRQQMGTDRSLVLLSNKQN